MPLIAVAALSARSLAEAAADEGYEVVALDVFGDADTRQAAVDWQPIGDPARLRIDGAALIAALRHVAARAEAAGTTALGWIAGGDFVGRPELLAEAAAALPTLPLLGTGAAAVRAVRDPARFFAALDAAGLDHPEVCYRRPADGAGWLAKDAGGCGGWQVERLGAAPAPSGDAGDAGDAAARCVEPAGRYFQREVPGLPMSATFIAAGDATVVLGFNALVVQTIGQRPFVHAGVLGPVAVPPGVAEAMTRAVHHLARTFGLRGLGSLDFIVDGNRARVLEINPRPPASLALYAGRGGGVIAAHIAACGRPGDAPFAPLVDDPPRARQTEDPPPAGHDDHPPSAGRADGPPRARHADDPSPDTIGSLAPRTDAAAAVRGQRIVYAPRAFTLSAERLRRLAAQPQVHDRPFAPQRFGAGDPVCSVGAAGATPAAVRALLEQRAAACLHLLENLA